MISVDDYLGRLVSGSVVPPAGAELTPPVRTRVSARALGWTGVDLAGVTAAPEAIALVPRAFAVRHNLLPLACEPGRLRVAVSDPLDPDGVDSLGSLTGMEILPALAPVEDIRAAIERCYGRLSVPREKYSDDSPAAAKIFDPEENDAPVIALVQSMIEEAVRRRASDIHVEPLAGRLRVRYRIDGALQEAEDPPLRLQAAIISRLKIMAGISIAEKRIPQDGRSPVTVAGRALDLRVSCLPTAHGESLVMRILDQEGLQPDLAELGFTRADRQAFERILALPDGIVLVTGPTGSGKTTTLYSALHHLNQPNRKIITVEDPVEYQLTGINQVPVRPEAGMTFAAALRAMLRQSPNVVMVGEIRDRETAEIALQAALTGHLVFSTLHTNDAAGAVMRLLDLGAKPFLVGTALRAVLAQRLVRRVCPQCRRPHAPEPRELGALGFSSSQTASATFMKGAGCPDCHGTGYHGRTGLFELLVMNDDLQALVHAGAGTGELRGQARRRGMRTLREDGARKASAGLTTIEEIISITAADLP